MSDPTCSTCQYRRGDECRRFPPPAEGVVTVAPSHWCGEYFPTPEALAPTAASAIGPAPERPARQRRRAR